MDHNPSAIQMQRGLGIGLPGARRLVDDFSIDSAPGQGTTITLVKWSRSQGRT